MSREGKTEFGKWKEVLPIYTCKDEREKKESGKDAFVGVSKEIVRRKDYTYVGVSKKKVRRKDTFVGASKEMVKRKDTYVGASKKKV